MKQRIKTLLEETLRGAGAEYAKRAHAVEIAETKDKRHGDYSSNIAMLLARDLGLPPREVATLLQGQIPNTDLVKRTEIAGPGFINFFLHESAWGLSLRDIFTLPEAYGKNEIGGGQRVQVEFVSANPTGPLHIGHARGAVVGDVIARLLAASGYDVTREYYINDTGNQLHNLGLSTWYRCRELCGENVSLPPSCYQGEYLREVARVILEQHPDILTEDTEAAISRCGALASEAIMEGIITDLKDFGVTFSSYFSERTLYERDLVAHSLEFLKRQGTAYRGEDGALWFRTTAFGDEKDRVLVRANGVPTYFAADIAYHHQKFAENFARVVDIWGADHHGYVARMRAGVAAMGHDAAKLDIVLIQLVALLRDGVPVAMSTRAGEFVTMREVVDEVGVDAARYNFLLRRSDSHLDFDLELAKRQSSDNPVYYVQYAHARAGAILRMAQEKGLSWPEWNDGAPEFLVLEEETAILRMLANFPEVVRAAAQALEPHRIAFYLNELSALFHSYYNKHKVISAVAETTSARLLLVLAVKTVVKNGLSLLGVSAPERM